MKNRRRTKNRRKYTRPVIARYRMSEQMIKEYNIASGGSNVRKCDTRECGGEGAGLSMPPWMEP